MDNFIIQKFKNFRQKIFSLFCISRDALMNLIDATASQRQGDSIVKISLSDLYCRHFSSISQAISNLFCQRCKGSMTEEDRKTESLKLTQLFVEQCPNPENRPFFLFGELVVDLSDGLHDALHVKTIGKRSVLSLGEKKRAKHAKRSTTPCEQSPSRVQRDYERIIRQIGTPACIPKRRGKSLGRKKGQVMDKRIKQLVIKKTNKRQKRTRKLRKAA